MVGVGQSVRDNRDGRGGLLSDECCINGTSHDHNRFESTISSARPGRRPWLVLRHADQEFDVAAIDIAQLLQPLTKKPDPRSDGHGCA
jgi:hypothetical protein